MKRKGSLVLVGCLAYFSLALADEAAAPSRPVSEQDKKQSATLPPGLVFEPPPVPAFMLEKPAQPLSLEEMVRQAREAERRAKASQAAASSEGLKENADKK